MAIGLGGLLAGTIGCGDGGPDEAERRQAYAEAFADVSVLDDVWSDEARLCAGRAVVTAEGLDALEDIGTPEQIRERDDRVPSEVGVELSGEEKQVFYEEMDACIGVQEVYVETLEAVGGELPDGVVGCVRDRADGEFLREWSHALFVEGHAPDAPDVQDLQRDVYSACLADEQHGGGL